MPPGLVQDYKKPPLPDDAPVLRESSASGTRTISRARKLALILVFSLAVLGLFALLAFGLYNKTPVTGRSGETRVGKPAPDFSISLLGGGEYRLAERGERPVVINFWASWCPPCRDEAPGLERTWRRYRDEGVDFVGVDIQDAEEDAAAYVEEFGLSFPNGRDATGEITVDYGVIGLPVTFFVAGDGTVVGRSVGALSEERLETWVRELLAGAQPP